MLTNALKSTSALALCAALAAPPSFAQEATAGSSAELPSCDLLGPFPCVTADGTVVNDAAELAGKGLEAAGDALGAALDAVTGVDEGETDPNAAPEATPTEEGVTVEPGDAGTEMSVDAPDDGTGVTGTEVTDPAGPEMNGFAPDDAPFVESETPDASGTTVAPATDPAEATSDTNVEADAATMEATAGATTEADGASMDAAPETAAPEMTAPAQAESAATEAPAATPPETPAEQLAASEAAAEPTTGPAASAAAAAAAEAPADAEAAPEAEVTTETVTAADSRSSSEDFQTTVAKTDQATAETSTDTGMTAFEKALLLGVGAVAVGAILANGSQIVANSGDRIVVRDQNGDLRVLKNDDENLRQPGSTVRTETFTDGSTRSVVTREDGTQIITIRAADGTAIKRTRILPDGSSYVLFDDTVTVQPVTVVPAPAPAQTDTVDTATTDTDALRAALMSTMNANAGRSYSLGQIREYRQVRALAPTIDVDAVTFATGSSVIEPSQAEELSALGQAIKDVIAQVPDAVFLVEGHTDAVGDASYNLALSDRRAESLALALTEYFGVPPENLVTQGYGEGELKVQTNDAERANRRAVVRNITPLL